MTFTGQRRPQTPSDVLRAAADYIEEHGWVQEDYERHGSVCVIGSLRAVVYGHPSVVSAGEDENDLARQALRHICNEVCAADRAVLACWNDSTDRTEAEVIAALRRAAERAEEKTNG